MSMTHDLLLLLLLTSTFILALLLPSSPCLQDLPFSAPQGMLMEDKIRLGSIPPNCRATSATLASQFNAYSPYRVCTVPGQTRADPKPEPGPGPEQDRWALSGQSSTSTPTTSLSDGNVAAATAFSILSRRSFWFR
ncbi:uncharacterized protein A4U43_C08F21270 [Asparagus officinalis]|nr:uncharacterized protein A4U43_C08F21270 [Asparagus officinalis]